MPRNDQNDILDSFTKALENPKFKLATQSAVRLDRLKQIFSRWHGDPLLTDRQMRDWIISAFGVSRDQAYSDLNLVVRLFGSAPKAEKEFMRVKANRLLELAIAAARAGDDKQSKSLTKIAEVIVKTNQLDQPDGEDYQWEEIVPRDESFSVDPTVIGIAKVPDIEEKSRRLLQQYTKEIDNIDADEQ